MKIYFLCGVCTVCLCFLCSNCTGKQEQDGSPLTISPEKNIHDLYNKVAREREKTSERLRQQPKEDETIRQKQMAVADACFTQYQSCAAKCSTGPCEDTCFSGLSACEKDLPVHLKTSKAR